MIDTKWGTPPPQKFAFSVYDRDIDKPGGAVAPTLEDHLAAPQHDHEAFVAATAAAEIAPDKSPDWVSKFLAAYIVELQGGTGLCVDCVANHLEEGTSLNIQGVVRERPSAPFSHLRVTGDATMALGSGLHETLTYRAANGNCKNSLWSMDYVLANFHGQPLEPPPAECYIDAPKRKILRWASLAFMMPDMNQIRLLINAGYWIGCFRGAHEFCIGMFDGPWYYGLDSEMDVDQTGHGVGVRAYHEDLIKEAYGFLYVLEVDVYDGTVTQTPGVNMTQRAKGIADWTALTGDTVTVAQRDVLVADAMALVVADAGPTDYDVNVYTGINVFPDPQPGATFGTAAPHMFSGGRRWTIPGKNSTLCVHDFDGTYGETPGRAIFIRPATDRHTPKMLVDIFPLWPDALLGIVMSYDALCAMVNTVFATGVPSNVPPPATSVVVAPPPPPPPPPPPTGVTYLYAVGAGLTPPVQNPPVTQLVCQGHTYKFTEFVEARYGSRLTAVDVPRGVGTYKVAAEKGGVLYVQNVSDSTWASFNADVWNPVFTPCPAP